MPRGWLGRWLCTGLAVAVFLSSAPASSAGTSSAEQGGLYVALGDSIAAGLGASSVFKGYVQLYYGYLQSNGSGVTDLLNPSRPGATSTDLRNGQLVSAVAVIDELSDTKAVTIDIGINDLYFDYPHCPTANAPPSRKRSAALPHRPLQRPNRCAESRKSRASNSERPDS